ncbi:sensor histidine kinase [Spirosoma panaciterrae]|uniref:sensor histidine kinase n=1 Tax=Spirosoma panaciterrae TaxID=496058 RepID=UPI000362D55C|nr:histidine kinase [Spirosoma panaciterrae]
MNLNIFTRQDTRIALFLLPAIYGFNNYALFGSTYFERWDVFLLATIAIILIWTPAYFLHAVPAVWLRRRFPYVRQIAMRLCLAWGIHLVMSSTVILACFYGYAWFRFPGFVFDAGRLQLTILLTAIINLIVNVVHESIYTFEQWDTALREADQLQQANLRSQLDGLKGQINPHFLFNALNSLSSLIEEDPEQAQQFIDEMSSVYRYMLRANETELATLDQELAFTRSYFHLLHTRHGDHLRLEEAISDQYYQHLIPPLTLQLLLENAVKHNVILPDQPLLIRIETSQDGKLIVQNNLQRKNSRMLSTKVGLANIVTKYKLLGEGDVAIEDEEPYFTVTIPLIKMYDV